MVYAIVIVIDRLFIMWRIKKGEFRCEKLLWLREESMRLDFNIALTT